jgi:hypothetical protein
MPTAPLRRIRKAHVSHLVREYSARLSRLCLTTALSSLRRGTAALKVSLVPLHLFRKNVAVVLSSISYVSLMTFRKNNGYCLNHIHTYMYGRYMLGLYCMTHNKYSL